MAMLQHHCLVLRCHHTWWVHLVAHIYRFTQTCHTFGAWWVHLVAHVYRFTQTFGIWHDHYLISLFRSLMLCHHLLCFPNDSIPIGVRCSCIWHIPRLP